MKTILDVCCGSRMFWYQRRHPAVLYADNRQETYLLKDKSSKGGHRELTVHPDQIADFTNLPFADGEFSVVVFDPPHLINAGKSGWMAKKYGVLPADWRPFLKRGFAECWRVLRPSGTLAFKWSQDQIKFSTVSGCFPAAPMFGDRKGKTRWTFFVKV